MATTPQQQRELIALTTLMFDAPPGAQYLAELSELVESGLSLEDVANELFNSPLFNSQFATSETERAKINHILENVGVSVNSPVYEEAYQFFADGLANGRSAAEMLVEAGEFLAATNDPRYAEAKATFVNKIEVGFFHSVTVERSSDSLDELQGVYAGVTSDPATIDEATGRVNTFRLEADGSNADLTDVELPENFTRIDLNGQSALLNAEQAGLVLLANGGSYSLQDSAEALLGLPESVLNGAVNITVTGATNVTQAVALNEIENSGSLSYSIEGSVNAIGTALRGDDSTDATREALANADAISVDGEITLNLSEYGLIGAALQTAHRIVDSADAVLAVDDEAWDDTSGELLQAVVLNAAPSERLSVDEALTLEARVTDFAGFTYNLSVSLSDVFSNGLWSEFANVDNVLLNEELDVHLSISQALTLESRISDFVNSVEFSVSDTPANIQQALNQNSSATSSLLANAESIVTNANGNVVTVNQIVGWLNAGAQLETLQFDLQAGQGALGSLSVSAASLRLDIIAQADNSTFIPTSYSLSDTIENLLLQADANADVLTGASSVTASDDAGMTQVKALLEAGLALGSNFTYSLSINPNRGDLDVETLTLEWDIIQAAQNTDDVLPVTYSITDTIDAILGLENALLNGASAINVEGTATLAEIQTLRDAGISLDDLTFALEGGEQGELTIGEAQAYQQIIAAASNDIELSDLTYTLADSVDNVLGELAGNVALLTVADAITLQGNATVEQIQLLLDAGIALDNLTFTLAGGDDLGELSLDGIADIQALNDQANNDVFDTLVYTLSDDIEGLVAAASNNTVALTQAAGITVEDDATVAQIQTLRDAGVALDGDFNYSLADPEALGNLSIADAEKAQAIAGNADAGGITYAIVDSWSDINGFIQNGGDTTLLSEADNINVTDNVTRDNIATLLAENVDLDDITFTLGAGQGNLGSNQSVEDIQQALDIILQAQNTSSVSLNFSLADDYENLLDAEGELQQPLLASASAVTVTDAVTVENAGRLQAQFGDSTLTFDISDSADAIIAAATGDAVTGAVSVTATTAELDVEGALVLEGLSNLDAASVYTLVDGAVAIADALIEDEDAFENATTITTNDEVAVDLTVAQFFALETAQVSIENGYNITDIAITIAEALIEDATAFEDATAIATNDEAAVDLTVAQAAELQAAGVTFAAAGYNIVDSADAIVAAATGDAITSAGSVTATTAELDVEDALVLEGLASLNADSAYTLVDGAVAIANALINEADAFENATDITTNDDTAVTLTVAQAAALQAAGVTFAAAGYNIVDSAEVIAAAAGDASVTDAEEVTATTAELDVAQALALEGLANLDTVSAYTLEGGAVAIATALIDSASAFENATAITTNDEAAVDLTVAQAAALQAAGVTIADAGFNIVDSANALSNNAIADEVFSGAENITFTNTALVSQIERLIEAGVELEHITFDLAAAEQDLGENLRVAQANLRLDILADAENSADLGGAVYSLSDTFTALEGEIEDNSTLLVDATAITIGTTADRVTRENIEALVAVDGVELDTLTYFLDAGQDNLGTVSVADAQLGTSIIAQSQNRNADDAVYALEDEIASILDGENALQDGVTAALLTDANAIKLTDGDAEINGRGEFELQQLPGGGDGVTVEQIQALLELGVNLEALTFVLDPAEFDAEIDGEDLTVADLDGAQGLFAIIDKATNSTQILEAFDYTLKDTAENLVGNEANEFANAATNAELIAGADSITVEGPATRSQIQELRDANADLLNITYTLGAGQGNLIGEPGGNKTIAEVRSALEVIQKADNSDSVTLRLSLEDEHQNILAAINVGNVTGSDNLPPLSILTRAESISIANDVSIADIQALLNADNDRNAGSDRPEESDIPLGVLDYALEAGGDYDFPETGTFALAEAADSEELTILLNANNFGELDYTLAISDDRANIFTEEGEGNAFAEGAATLLNAATSVVIEHAEATQNITLAQYALFENLSTFDVANLTFALEDTIAGAERFELDVASGTFDGGVFEVTGSNYARFEADLNTAAGDDDITLNFANEVLANRFVIDGDMGDGEDSLTLDIPNLTNEDDEAALEYTIENVEHLTLNFGDSDDTLVLTSNSVMELASLTVVGGTLDATQANTFSVAVEGGTGSITLNSSLILTEEQYRELVGDDGDRVVFKTETDSESTIRVTRDNDQDLYLRASGGSENEPAVFDTEGTIEGGVINENGFDPLKIFRVAEDSEGNQLITEYSPATPFTADLTIANLADAADGDTITIDNNGTPVVFARDEAGVWSPDQGNEGFSLTVIDAAEGTVTVSSDDEFTVTGYSSVIEARAVEAEVVVEQSVTVEGGDQDPFTADLTIADLVEAAENDTITIDNNGTPVVFARDEAGVWSPDQGNEGFSLTVIDAAEGTVTVSSDDEFTVTGYSSVIEARAVDADVVVTEPVQVEGGDPEQLWSAVIELSGTGTDETDFQEDQSYNFTLTLTEQGEGSTLETFTLLDASRVDVISQGDNIADQLAQQINQAFGDEFTATTDDGNLVIEAVDPETNYDVSTIFVEIA